MGGLPKYPQFPLRIDTKIINKIRYIANENCRSANKEIELIIRNYIKSYETDNGEITDDDIEQMFDNLC